MTLGIGAYGVYRIPCHTMVDSTHYQYVGIHFTNITLDTATVIGFALWPESYPGSGEPRSGSYGYTSFCDTAGTLSLGFIITDTVSFIEIWAEPTHIDDTTYWATISFDKINMPCLNYREVPVVSTVSSEDHYHYGYNGQMKDNEYAGVGNHYNAEFWEYDPRVARRWNQDPVYNPSISPYAVFDNSPILENDVLGDAAEQTEHYNYQQEQFNNFLEQMQAEIVREAGFVVPQNGGGGDLGDQHGDTFSSGGASVADATSFIRPFNPDEHRQGLAGDCFWCPHKDGGTSSGNWFYSADAASKGTTNNNNQKPGKGVTVEGMLPSCLISKLNVLPSFRYFCMRLHFEGHKLHISHVHWHLLQLDHSTRCFQPRFLAVQFLH